MLRDYSGYKKHSRDFIINQHLQALANYVEPVEGGGYYMAHTTSDDVKQFLSTKSITELKPIHINDLVIGKTHTGFYLKVKIALKCTKMTAVVAVIEDDNKSATRLAVYNFFTPQNFKYHDVYYAGRTLYIIEPYFKVASDGIETIRVDQPNDILFDEQIVLDPKLDASSLKETADRAFREQNYELAVSFYDAAISRFDSSFSQKTLQSKLQLDKEIEKVKLDYDIAIKKIKLDYEAKLVQINLEQDAINEKSEAEQNFLSIIYSNKANCLNLLKRHEMAIDSALNSVEFDPSYSKGRFHLVKSLLETGNLEDAEKHLTSLMELVSEDKTSELTDKLQRYKKFSKGIVDWSQVFLSIRNNNPLDVCNFVSDKLEVKSTGVKKGLGVFALQNISKGELIIINKAFCLATSQEVSSVFGKNLTHVDISWSSSSMSSEHRSILKFKTEHIFLKDKHRMLEFGQLCNKQTIGLSLNDRKRLTARTENYRVDLIKSAIEKNTFGSIDFSLFSIRQTPIENSGIWIYPSFFNHSCDPNVSWFTAGSVMFMKAAKDVVKGEELFVSYISLDLISSERKKNLSGLGFECQCSRDQFENNKNPSSYSYRNYTFDQFRNSSLKEIEKAIADLKKALEVASIWYKTYIFNILLLLQGKTSDYKGSAETLISFYSAFIKEGFPSLQDIIVFRAMNMTIYRNLEDPHLIVEIEKLFKKLIGMIFTDDDKSIDEFYKWVSHILEKSSTVENPKNEDLWQRISKNRKSKK
jgi:tetratricopeptide (TPR) repeat protein